MSLRGQWDHPGRDLLISPDSRLAWRKGNLVAESGTPTLREDQGLEGRRGTLQHAGPCSSVPGLLLGLQPAEHSLLGGWRGRAVQGPGDDPRFLTGWSQESSGSSRVPGSHPSGTWGVSRSPVGSESPITFGVGEEPLTLGRSAEWTLETAPCPAIVLAF